MIVLKYLVNYDFTTNNNRKGIPLKIKVVKVIREKIRKKRNCVDNGTFAAFKGLFTYFDAND